MIWLMLTIPNLLSLQWRHDERDGRRFECLLNRLFRRRSTSKLCVTGLCEGNSPVAGEFPARRASNAENVSIWWRHHVLWVLNSDWIVNGLGKPITKVIDMSTYHFWDQSFVRTQKVYRLAVGKGIWNQLFIDKEKVFFFKQLFQRIHIQNTMLSRLICSNTILYSQGKTCSNTTLRL